MTKTNLALLDDNNKRRKEVSKLKNELKTQQEAHEAQLQEMRTEFEMALSHREMEVKTMQQNLLASGRMPEKVRRLQELRGHWTLRRNHRAREHAPTTMA